MKNILEDLYYGRISPWERRPKQNEERKAVNRKIEDEKRYFISKMSVDDCQRFQALENLFTQSHEFEEIDLFSHGFALGVLIMMAISEHKEGVVNE